MRRKLKKIYAAWRVATAGGLTAGFLLTYLVALPPHLVHHLFETEPSDPFKVDLSQSGCSHLAQSQTTTPHQTDAPSLIPPIPTEILHALFSGTSLPSPTLRVNHPRAPPCLTPSA